MENKQPYLDTSIKLLFKELIEIYNIAYKELKPSVERIIKENITNKDTIEDCLEKLLNIPTDACYKLFIKLCDYYARIDLSSSLEYLKIYEELYGEDDIKIKKKDYKPNL